MKLSIAQVEQAIRDQSQLLKDYNLVFVGCLPDHNPASLMDEVFRLHSILMELNCIFTRCTVDIKFDFNGESYSIAEAILWGQSLVAMADLWFNVYKTAEWAQLMNLWIALRIARAVAENVPRELGDVDPLLFKGTSVQSEVDKQVL